MLQPGQQLLQEAPPVLGRPWYWQRSAAESSRGLAQVLMEMRDEIQKLEAENRELKGGHGSQVPPAAGAEENPYVNLRRNASAPVLEGQYKENTVMTVRRYSISSNLSGVTMREGGPGRSQRTESAWGRLQGDIQHGHFSGSARGDVGKVTNRRSLQEYVHKNRAKVKTVTFLLPVDDIYTNRPVLTKHRDETEPRITELASITETDS